MSSFIFILAVCNKTPTSTIIVAIYERSEAAIIILAGAYRSGMLDNNTCKRNNGRVECHGCAHSCSACNIDTSHRSERFHSADHSLCAMQDVATITAVQLPYTEALYSNTKLYRCCRRLVDCNDIGLHLLSFYFNNSGLA